MDKDTRDAAQEWLNNARHYIDCIERELNGVHVTPDYIKEKAEYAQRELGSVIYFTSKNTVH